MKKILVLLFLLSCVSSIKGFCLEVQSTHRTVCNDETIIQPTTPERNNSVFFSLAQLSIRHVSRSVQYALEFSKTEDVPVDMAVEVALFTKIIFTYWFPFVKTSAVAENEQYLIAQRSFIVAILLDKHIVYQSFLI